MNKQLTMSLINDKLAQATTRKKEFPGIMEELVPWAERAAKIRPYHYKGERGNKPYEVFYSFQGGACVLCHQADPQVPKDTIPRPGQIASALLHTVCMQTLLLKFHFLTRKCDLNSFDVVSGIYEEHP